MKRKLQFNITDFDFIRLSTPDLNGCHLSKFVSSELAQRITDNEMDMYGGVIALGPRMEYVEFDEFKRNNFQNAFLHPDMETLRPVKWADDKERHFKVGDVIADMRWNDKSPLDFHPRIVAKQQIKRLEDLGLTIYAAFEPEFRAFKINSFEPFSTGVDLYKTSLLAKYQNFFMDSVKKLSEAGIEIQDCCVEHGEGQLEMPLLPSFGISAADKAFRFKQGIKELAKEHNMDISFMTQPILAESSSGNHFNHSLWHKTTGKNAMYSNEGEDNLSDLALYWIGGLLHHGSAISALCCPTVNCYRRFHHFLAPGPLNWNINSRLCTIRVKNFSEKSTYVESRLPSSAACPYHVLAATIAAGIDGIVNQILPPPKGDNSKGVLPTTFEEALDILEKDEVIKKALGESFVDYFIKIKRNVDLKEADKVKSNDEDLLNLERKLYFEYI